jgi:hypothetical protein
MSQTLFDGLDMTVEIALTSATGACAIWDASLWNTGLWGPDVTWVDVSAYVRSFSTKRAFSTDLRTWSSGSLSIVLNNMDGRFSPDNLAGPYVAAGVTGIRPGRPVRITLTYLGVTYPVIRGFARSWDETPNLVEPRLGDAIMNVTGNDPWSSLAKINGTAVGAVGSGETFGFRINRILNAAGDISPRDLDAGSITLQATTLSDAPITEIGVVSASEGGAVWVEADGTITGRRRYSLVEDYRSVTVQATFGDSPGEVMWSEGGLSVAPLDDEMTINTATYTRVGGTPQRSADVVSQALYGICEDTASNTDNLVCENDADVATLAQWAVMLGKTPEGRVTSLTFRPRCDPTTLFPLMLDRKIRDLVQVNIRPPSATSHTMSRNCFISGISHTVDRGDWVITFELSPATTYKSFAGSRFDFGLWGSSDTDPAAALWFI